MIASVDRIGSALHIGPRLGWLVVISGLVAVAASTALATRLGQLPALLAIVLLGLMTLVSFRWPYLTLAAFAALIPVEEVIFVEGLGTISRLAGILFAVAYGLPRLGQLRLGGMPPAAWGYLAWATLSLGWAIDPDIAWTQLLTLLQLFLIAVLIADFVAHRPSIVRPLLWVYSISATATAVVGIIVYATGGFGIRAAAIQDQDPNQFAAVLAPAVIFGIYEALHANQRVFGVAVAMTTGIAILVSGARGAWIAVAVAIIVFSFPQLSPRRRVTALVLGLATLGLASQLPGVYDLFVERTGSALSTGGAGRTDIWSVGLTIYRSAPLEGVGYANFPVAYTSEAVRATDIRSFSSALLEGRAPHNLAVGTLVELGAIGALLIVLFLAPLVLRRGWGPDGATVQAMLASLMTLAMFLDILANRKQVWLVIGLAAGLAFLARARGNERADETATPAINTE